MHASHLKHDILISHNVFSSVVMEWNSVCTHREYTQWAPIQGNVGIYINLNFLHLFVIIAYYISVICFSHCCSKWHQEYIREYIRSPDARRLLLMQAATAYHLRDGFLIPSAFKFQFKRLIIWMFEENGKNFSSSPFWYKKNIEFVYAERFWKFVYRVLNFFGY